MTPTKDPLTELATQLAALSGADVRNLQDTLTGDLGPCSQVARQAAWAQRRTRPGPARRWRPAARSRIVDQFEQLFTLSSDQGARQRFVVALHAMTTNLAVPPKRRRRWWCWPSGVISWTAVGVLRRTGRRGAG